ncbi:MAG: hypothetical protein ACKOW0_00865 [Schleiferiaceae bacterium]
MTITTRDQLIDALANNTSRVVLDKASLASQTAGRLCSLWRATGQPAQGAIPTSPAVCDDTLLGGVQFTQQVSPTTSYLAYMALLSSNSAMSWEIHDRLAHMGGLALNVTTTQTTNLPLDLDTLAPSAARVGDSNYGDVQTWLEVYADGGNTASNATINVTFHDNSSGNLNVQAVGGTIRIGNMFSVDALRTTAQQGLNIKRINSVTLSVSTGAAGNFGFTFTRPRAFVPTQLANLTASYDWAQLGLPQVPNGSCLQFIVMPSTTTTGTLRGGGKIVHG